MKLRQLQLPGGEDQYTKATILGSANPNGGNYLQLGIQPNAGGGAPADYYFDNFTFTTVPEPAALGLLSAGAIAMLSRRRRST